MKPRCQGCTSLNHRCLRILAVFSWKRGRLNGIDRPTCLALLCRTIIPTRRRVCCEGCTISCNVPRANWSGCSRARCSMSWWISGAAHPPLATGEVRDCRETTIASCTSRQAVPTVFACSRRPRTSSTSAPMSIPPRTNMASGGTIPTWGLTGLCPHHCCPRKIVTPPPWQLSHRSVCQFLGYNHDDLGDRPSGDACPGGPVSLATRQFCRGGQGAARGGHHPGVDHLAGAQSSPSTCRYQRCRLHRSR